MFVRCKMDAIERAVLSKSNAPLRSVDKRWPDALQIYVEVESDIRFRSCPKVTPQSRYSARIVPTSVHDNSVNRAVILEDRRRHRLDHPRDVNARICVLDCIRNWKPVDDVAKT